MTRDELVFHCSAGLSGMYKLSPCVWQENGRFDLLLRVVNRSMVASEKVARIHYGTSKDGIEFSLEEAAVISPDPDPNAFDNGGCEDPTVAYVDGTYYVYYSGWNEHVGRGELLLAAGPDVHHLKKLGRALPASARIANPKEATIVQVQGGSWRLFFEYAHEGKSKIGLAAAHSAGGPWEVREPLFEARPQSWDSWHLSTGPILDSNPQSPVMFYNGATRDAHWRIGWVVFNADFTRMIARSADPVVLADVRRNADDTDIAFAASALEIDKQVHLYYSVADQYCMRAIIDRF